LAARCDRHRDAAAVLHTSSRSVGGSRRNATPPAAAITGTESWKSAARVAVSEGSAAYQSV